MPVFASLIGMPMCIVYLPPTQHFVMKILMVCLGNICRSPLAEGILKYHAGRNGLDWQIESAGTSAYHAGEPPHRLSQKVALLHGIDISAQQSRQFVAADMDRYDRIYVMDEDNYTEVQTIAGEHWQSQKIKLLLDELNQPMFRNIPDPWYGGEEGYHKVFALIDEACKQIIESTKISAV